MSLPDDLDLIAEHIGDDQPNLPEGAKNTLLLAAKLIRKLPHTADGVPVVPGMEVWTTPPPSRTQATSHSVVYIRNNSPRIGITDGSGVLSTNLQNVYSTREAAEKASEA